MQRWVFWFWVALFWGFTGWLFVAHLIIRPTLDVVGLPVFLCMYSYGFFRLVKLWKESGVSD